MAENRTMKEKPALCIQGMARKFVRESIIEDAATRLIVQIMTEVADAHIAPRDAEIASLRAQLDEARRKAIDECAAIAQAFAEVTARLDGGITSTASAGMFNIANVIRALLSESKT